MRVAKKKRQSQHVLGEHRSHHQKDHHLGIGLPYTSVEDRQVLLEAKGPDCKQLADSHTSAAGL